MIDGSIHGGPLGVSPSQITGSRPQLRTRPKVPRTSRCKRAHAKDRGVIPILDRRLIAIWRQGWRLHICSLDCSDTANLSFTFTAFRYRTASALNIPRCSSWPTGNFASLDSHRLLPSILHLCVTECPLNNGYDCRSNCAAPFPPQPHVNIHWAYGVPAPRP
jgi:hypothetical protein